MAERAWSEIYSQKSDWYGTKKERKSLGQQRQDAKKSVGESTAVCRRTRGEKKQIGETGFLGGLMRRRKEIRELVVWELVRLETGETGVAKRRYDPICPLIGEPSIKPGSSQAQHRSTQTG